MYGRSMEEEETKEEVTSSPPYPRAATSYRTLTS